MPPLPVFSGPGSKRVATVEQVHRLPFEEYASADEIAAWPVAKLKEDLRRSVLASPARLTAHADAGASALEKSELVVAVRAARGEETACSICFDDYLAGDGLRVLPCGHRFHIECIDRWLRAQSSKCPLCNAQAV